MFWRTNSWAASINYLNIQLTSTLLSNIILILTFSIITFIVEQATTYIRRRKIMRATISFKCTDFVELSFIESTCIFLFFIVFDDAMIFFFWHCFYFFVRNAAKHLFKQFERNIKQFAKSNFNERVQYLFNDIDEIELLFNYLC